MKTTKIISAISLLLIFAAAGSLFAGNNVRSGKTPADRVKVINYIVNINNRHNVFSSTGHYRIILTDETGRQVAPAQAFHFGVWSYAFTEVGNVYGTRIARMERELSTPGSGAVSSVSRTGMFLGGQTYLYIIIPHPLMIEPGNPKN